MAHQQVSGLTTAIGLFGTACLGLAAGAVIGLERSYKNRPAYCLALRYRHKLALDQVLRYCKDKRPGITDLQVTGTSDPDATVYDAVVSLRARGHVDFDALLSQIRGIPGILEAEERPRNKAKPASAPPKARSQNIC